MSLTILGSPTHDKVYMKDFFETYDDRGYKEIEYFDDVRRSDDLYVVDSYKDDDNDNKFELIQSLYYLREDMLVISIVNYKNVKFYLQVNACEYLY